MIPAHARQKRLLLEDRYRRLQEYSEKTPLNRIEWQDKKVGVITSGISYQYVKEALPMASVLKLGFTWPLPENLIRSLAREVETLYVIEENEPYLEEQARALGLQVMGKALFPITGELSAAVIRRALGTNAVACLLYTSDAADE